MNENIKVNMTFGEALECLKKGEKVYRKGWNGKGMWIVLMSALYLMMQKILTIYICQ